VPKKVADADLPCGQLPEIDNQQEKGSLLWNGEGWAGFQQMKVDSTKRSLDT
jgi:hypothetical protein